MPDYEAKRSMRKPTIMTANRKLVILLLLTWINSASGEPRQLVGVYDDQIRARLATAAETGASGILRITLAGEEVFESGFGSATCQSYERVSTRHLFMIGSITKEFTRVLAHVLEEKRIISFADTVVDWIPGFTGPIGAVTVQQLLRHTGGLPDLIDRSGQPVRYRVAYDFRPTTRAQLIASANLAALIHEPGADEQYSNLGYQLLAAIFEIATGEPYPELLKNYIYLPAGMEETGYWFENIGTRKFADGCDLDGAYWGNPIEDRMWPEPGPSWNLLGAGGLLSTAESLGKFFEGIGEGVYFDSPVRTEKFKLERLVFSSRLQQRVMAPAGSNGIFNAVSLWADDAGFNVILMTNRAKFPAEGALFRDILHLFPAAAFDTPTEDVPDP